MRGRMFWAAWMLGALFVLSVGGDLAAARKVKLVIELPSGVPTGLPVPIPARIEGKAIPGAVLSVRHVAFGKEAVFAQCEVNGRVAWLVAAVRDGQAGQRELHLRGKVVGKAREGRVVRFEDRKGGIECLDGDRKVMFYQRDPHSRDAGKHVAANYFHPLYGLDGEVLTQDFPADHPHHHGVFWAWHQLLVGTTRAGDPWVNKDFLPVVRKAEAVESGPVFATLVTAVDWTSNLVTDADGRPRPIVSESGRFRVFHAVGETRHIDFRIRLSALLKDVKIGGSENVKGYSGFTVRVKPPMEMQIQDRRGRVDADAVGSTSPWADISGRFGGRAIRSGVSILCDKRLPEFPPKWLLRFYGMQNVAYPGRLAVRLEQEHPLILRHRLVVHRGAGARPSEQQRAFQSLTIR
ncbi:MAG: hypothetical protein CMJ68_03590 [Planctomycetaceae bacterium]|nr:hypothetical protein [Planctomycetaceae bacterium]